MDDLLEELARARLWVPLPAGGPVTDGSAVALPTGHLPRRRVRAGLHLGAAPQPLAGPVGPDVTFPGESEPDLVDDWVARNTRPFYTRE